MLKSLFSAFLMYSRIPMPNVEWKEENRRYSLGLFPLVGAVEGIIFILWRIVCDLLCIGDILFSAVSVFIPVVVTGGIHLDGFCDVTDAVASFADGKKRLEIMSDSHVGSFAVIHICIYFILQAGLFSQVNNLKLSVLIAAGYVLSRSLSGFSAVTFKSAKTDGTLQSFVKPAHRKITGAMLIFFIAASCTAMLFCGLFTGISCIISAAVVFAYYRKSAYKNFGGITGDLCGWFLQLCEIWILAAAVFSEKLLEVLK